MLKASLLAVVTVLPVCWIASPAAADPPIFTITPPHAEGAGCGNAHEYDITVGPNQRSVVFEYAALNAVSRVKGVAADSICHLVTRASITKGWRLRTTSIRMAPKFFLESRTDAAEASSAVYFVSDSGHTSTAVRSGVVNGEILAESRPFEASVPTAWSPCAETLVIHFRADVKVTAGTDRPAFVWLTSGQLGVDGKSFAQFEMERCS